MLKLHRLVPIVLGYVSVMKYNGIARLPENCTLKH